MLIILALLVQDDKLLDVIQKHPLGVNCVPFQRVSEFVGLNSLPVFVLAENVPHRGFGLVSNRKTTYRKLLLFDYLIQTCEKSFCIRTLPCITPSFTLSFYIQIYITFTEALTKKKIVMCFWVQAEVNGLFPETLCYHLFESSTRGWPSVVENVTCHIRW